MRQKGPRPLHEQLRALLQRKWKDGELTQESLANAIEMDQTSAGHYLRGDKAGMLDLDEADMALRHINSSLMEFVNDPARVPIAPPAEKLPPVLGKIVATLRNVRDEEALRIVLGLAKSVRAAARRKEKQPGPRHVGVRAKRAAPTELKRRRRRATDQQSRRGA